MYLPKITVTYTPKEFLYFYSILNITILLNNLSFDQHPNKLIASRIECRI